MDEPISPLSNESSFFLPSFIFFFFWLESSPQKFLFNYLSGPLSDLHCGHLTLWKDCLINFSHTCSRMIKTNESVWVNGASSSRQIRILQYFWKADSNVFFPWVWASVNFFRLLQNADWYRKKPKRQRNHPCCVFSLGSLSLTWLAVKEQQMPETQIDRQRWKAQKLTRVFWL